MNLCICLPDRVKMMSLLWRCFLDWRCSSPVYKLCDNLSLHSLLYCISSPKVFVPVTEDGWHVKHGLFGGDGGGGGWFFTS